MSDATVLFEGWGRSTWNSGTFGEPVVLPGATGAAGVMLQLLVQQAFQQQVLQELEPLVQLQHSQAQMLMSLGLKQQARQTT